MRLLRALGVVASAAMALAAPAAAQEAPPAVRFLAGPHHLVELPPHGDAKDEQRAAALLRSLEELASALDAEALDAGVAAKKDLPKPEVAKRFAKDGPDRLAAAPAGPPRGPRLWSVRVRRTRPEMEALCAAVPAKANTQGTAFYRNTAEGFLGVVDAEGAPADAKAVRGAGADQYLCERLGVCYLRAGQPRGACVPEGFIHFLRWSHVPEGAELPRALGGIAEDYAAKLRARIESADASFPSLATLFAATPKDLDADAATLYGASVLLTEFLWETSKPTRRGYLRALRAYGASGRPVAEFPLATLLKELGPAFRDAAALEAAFRKFVLESSPEVNAKKREPAPPPAGGGK